jgi:hypothetical protein
VLASGPATGRGQELELLLVDFESGVDAHARPASFSRKQNRPGGVITWDQ